MDALHDRDNEITAPIVKNLQQNIETVEALFADCADFIKREYTIGGKNKVDIFFFYMDNMIDKDLVEEDTLKYLLYHMDELPAEHQFEYILKNGFRTADFAPLEDFTAACNAVLSGDTVLLVDGTAKAIKISIRGMANRGIPKAESEVTVRGSNEAFSEALHLNRVLIRKRLRDTHLKIKQVKIGTRTMTDVAIVYLDGVAKPENIKEIERRLENFKIDGIFDSGMLEQLSEREHYSPFPEFQATERPDKAASALTEGRIVLIVDNSPMVLILPATLNTFFQASDDAYTRWEVATFKRIIRYIAAFIAVALPGLYIAVVNFESELISPSLALSFAAARQAVPFSVLVEVIIMEIAFEMLLEAGIRLPGPMGSTLGIVGGLIIGDAAVNAGLASPMVVIVVALTAIAAFTVPNEAFADAFRLVRYVIIFLSALLGFYGFMLGIILVMTHLCALQSFGTPYLIPYAASGVHGESGYKDSIIKLPTNDLKLRPSFARKDNRRRLRYGLNEERNKKQGDQNGSK